MTIGVGGSTAEIELDKISDMTTHVNPIQPDEFQKRIEKATALIQSNGFEAVYFHAGTNLYYFTGTRWSPSERMVGVILDKHGQLDYIAPKFEEGTLQNFMLVEGPIHCWEEHESPFELFGQILKHKGISSGKIGMDESAPFFLTHQIQKSHPEFDYENAYAVTAGCRMFKSDAEIALIQQAKNITIEIQKAAARILYPGIPQPDVVNFIHRAHIKAGIPSGSYFCIVLFGEDSQYPHGVPHPQPLIDNDVVLIDTGCQLYGYISDITRTYIYGEPNEHHREIWNLEKAAQAAAFNQAQIGNTCGSVDDAVRQVLSEAGLSADYELPGLPHRVGHGTGLDIHEYPYLVRGNETVLQKGMVMSNEPMICIPGKFGIRHEDHFYMADDGPKWFTTPMDSIDNPFGYST